jgi:multicomponent Na+:H+ antiporter subunit E
MITWMIFSGMFDAFHLTLGVISSAVVAGFTSSFFWGVKADERAGVPPRRVPGAVLYFFWLLYEIVRANMHVFYLAFHPHMKEMIHPRIFSFKTSLRSDYAKFVLGNSITLTPGTVTLRIEGDLFVVHAITRKAASGLPGAMEERVKKVFEP